MRLDEFVIFLDERAIDDAIDFMNWFRHLKSVPRLRNSPYKIPIHECASRETIWIQPGINTILEMD